MTGSLFPDGLSAGSFVIERYTYERLSGRTKGVQWLLVQRVERDGSLAQLIALDTRREAAEWIANA